MIRLDEPNVLPNGEPRDGFFVMSSFVTEWNVVMGSSRRFSSLVSAVVAIAALATGALTSTAPASASAAVGVDSAPLFFLPQHHGDQDMANNGLWLNVRIANAHNDLSVVELWEQQKAPQAGYVYYKNLYDGSYLTAPSTVGGGVYTSPFQASASQMWKASLQHDLSYGVRNLALGNFVVLTYHAAPASTPFTMSPSGAVDQRFYINHLATASSGKTSLTDVPA